MVYGIYEKVLFVAWPYWVLSLVLNKLYVHKTGTYVRGTEEVFRSCVFRNGKVGIITS